MFQGATAGINKAYEDKLLSEEFNHLQIVYSKMKCEYSNCNISFTGYNAGADLGFLNTLFAYEENNATTNLFYSDIKELQDYYNFMPHDINKDYENNLQICIEGAGGITKEATHRIILNPEYKYNPADEIISIFIFYYYNKLKLRVFYPYLRVFFYFFDICSANM